jgi:hypothetical protein
MIDLGLPFGLGVEFDALYHRFDYEIGNSNFAGSVDERERANSWEFPILLKYRLPVPLIKPFVEAGVSPRSISGTIAQSGVNINIMTGQQNAFSGSMKTNWSSSVGAVIGFGVRVGLGRVRLSPELRYTHWTSTPINVSFGDGPSFQSAQEQIDLMVGIGWKIH